jgi:hypothetical protein
VRVLGENRDAVALGGAELCQRIREAINPIVKFAVGEPSTVENDGFRIGVGPGSVSRYVT